MAEKLENLLNNAVQGKPYGSGNNSSKDTIKIDKPMTLKHSLDSALGKPAIFNEGTDFNNIDND